MECEPSRLPSNWMFEWQKYSQEALSVPHYSTLLEFISLCTQVSELSVFDLKRGPGHQTLAPYSASTEEANCVACKETEHPCAKFRDLPFEQRNLLVKSKILCMNCLKVSKIERQKLN